MKEELEYVLGTTTMFHGPGTLRWVERCDHTTLNEKATAEAVKFLILSEMLPCWPTERLLAMAKGEYTTEIIDDETVRIIFTEKQS